MIICIGREFGSGGHEIGKRLAENLGYDFYDRDLVEKSLARTTIPSEEIERADERKINPLLYRVWYDSQDESLRGMSANDILFRIQSKLISDIARKGNCIFIGRSADFILQKAGIDHISLFIAAPFEDRLRREMKLLNISEKEASSLIRRTDKERKSYYNYYTDRDWGKPSNYDFCINSSKFGIDKTVEFLTDFFKKQ
ncbi:MAG: cytidylate kinase-like family protein [Candidatus Alectryocaccobium sp.]|nr:cytidylate kinase-like family protein [Candidatus Alectryocaccobium sp.]